jgi:hypothetical protein
VIHRGDISAVEEVLGWDPRGDAEKYEAVKKAQKAFSRIKKELNSIKKELNSQRNSAKEWREKYAFQEVAIEIALRHAKEEP